MLSVLISFSFSFRCFRRMQLLAALPGCRKTAPKAVIRRCAAFVNAHISMYMLRFPKRRTPWLTA
jgi:hypothetical protein